VDVVEQPNCGITQVYTFTVYNDSPFSVTVDLGMITFNVPASWTVTTVPKTTLELDPWGEGTVEVHVWIPCPRTLSATHADDVVYRIQAEAGSVPIIDVEGYIEGELVGGVELRFPFEPGNGYLIYFPLIMR